MSSRKLTTEVERSSVEQLSDARNEQERNVVPRTYVLNKPGFRISISFPDGRRWIVFVSLSVLSLLFLYHYWLSAAVAKPVWDFGSAKHDVSIRISNARTIEIPIDHFNESDTRTFKNRYWVNDTFYKAGGPVFFHDAGEASVSDQAMEYMSSGRTFSAQLELAKKYNGIFILWEHRFYGESLPFEINQTTGIAFAGYEAYKYLTNEQALEDAVYLATHIELPGHEAGSLRSNHTPWIWIGGSYAGIRAAIIRQRNPDVFFASWSSSAPMKTQVQAPVYYNPIYQAMPKNCSFDVHSAITFADELLTSRYHEEETILLRNLIFYIRPFIRAPMTTTAKTPEDLTHWEIAEVLAYVFQRSFVALQSFGYERSLGKFCDRIESWDRDSPELASLDIPSAIKSLEQPSFDGAPTDEGIAATQPVQVALHAFLAATFAKIKEDNEFFLGTGPWRKPLDHASWTWQLCSQFAQFHISPYPSSTSLISKFYDWDNHDIYYCRDVHPYLPLGEPDVEEILKYGGWEMNPSNVMFTAGELDPWRTLGVQSDVEINPEALGRKSTRVIPRCGETPRDDEVFGIVHKGAYHVADFQKQRGGPKGAVDISLALFEEALNVWLPCFGGEEQNGNA